jgi:hypothetical protein
MTMEIPTIVDGPFLLTDGSLVVTHPDVAVLFRNGRPWKFLAAGKYRAILGQLPTFGDRQYLLFDGAEFGIEVDVPELHLGDGHVVGVRCSVWVRPAWSAEPDKVLEYARRFGVRTSRYLEPVEGELRSALVRELTRVARALDHATFLQTDWGRSIALGLVDAPLAKALRVTVLETHADPHASRVTAAVQAGELDAIRSEQRHAQEHLETIATVDRARLLGLGEAELHIAVAKLLNVDPWSAAYPDAANEIRLTQARAAAAMLTEYRDMLSPAELSSIQQLLGGAASVAAATGAPPIVMAGASLADVESRVRRELAANPSLIQVGVAAAPAGSRIVVCIVAAASSNGEIVPPPDVLARATGSAEVNVLHVANLGGPVETAVQVLADAFGQPGMPEAELRVDPSGTGVIVTLVGQPADPELVAGRLIGWNRALQDFVAPATLTVNIAGVER